MQECRRDKNPGQRPLTVARIVYQILSLRDRHSATSLYCFSAVPLSCFEIPSAARNDCNATPRLATAPSGELSVDIIMTDE